MSRRRMVADAVDLGRFRRRSVPEPTADDVRDPSKLVRLATMARILLREVNTAELDANGRQRMADAHRRSVEMLAELFPAQLREEFTALQPILADGRVPSASELRVAQAQLVGWLEGLFHGVHVALLSQRLASQEQLAHLYAEAMERERVESERARQAPYL
jgi:hypothetical protein